MTDLFRPYALGPLRLRNRFGAQRHDECRADERGVVGQIIARYEELAVGGAGLIIKGHLYVDPRGKAHTGMGGHSATTGTCPPSPSWSTACTATAASSSRRSTTPAVKRRPANAWARATSRRPRGVPAPWMPARSAR